MSELKELKMLTKAERETKIAALVEAAKAKLVKRQQEIIENSFHGWVSCQFFSLDLPEHVIEMANSKESRVFSYLSDKLIVSGEWIAEFKRKAALLGYGDDEIDIRKV